MISTGDRVCICAITAFILVIFRIEANSELRQKVLDLVLTIKSYLHYWGGREEKRGEGGSIPPNEILATDLLLFACSENET